VSAGGGRRVIHLVPPGGGGVDRCVRDIVRLRPGDLIVHVTDSQCVLEQPDRAQFTPLAPADLSRLAGSGALGGPSILHAHSTVAAVRQVCGSLSAATGAPTVLTLHDIWFADPTLVSDELEQRLAFARAAVARTAPSAFIIERARQALGDAAPCTWIANGVDALRPIDEAGIALSAAARQACGVAGFPIAVIGAIGEHKGLTALETVARLLPDGQRVVVLGYTERQLKQGWAVEGRIWVHGSFEPDELPVLVKRYSSRLAFFPPGMPESFCYALSDAWMSGLTVLAPDHGALGERVRHHGGGALYPPQDGAEVLARRLVEQLAGAVRCTGPVALRHPLPSMEGMMAAMDDLYRQHAKDGEFRPVDDESLRQLAQKHLDSRFCRREVLDLQRELEDLARVRAEFETRLAARDAELAAALRARDAWQARYRLLVERLRRPVAWLPAAPRERLVRLAKRLLRVTPSP